MLLHGLTVATNGHEVKKPRPFAGGRCDLLGHQLGTDDSAAPRVHLAESARGWKTSSTRVNFIRLTGLTPAGNGRRRSYAASHSGNRAGGSRLVLAGGDAGPGCRSRDRSAAPGARRQGLDYQRREPDQPALFDAETDRYDQRQTAQGSLDDPPQRLRAWR